MPARLRSPGRHAHLLPFPARRPVPVFLALFFFDDSRAPSHFIPLHPAKLLGEWFAQACVIRHRVWHVSLLFGEVMKSARGARFTRGRGPGECHRPRLTAKIDQYSLLAIL